MVDVLNNNKSWKYGDRKKRIKIFSEIIYDHLEWGYHKNDHQ